MNSLKFKILAGVVTLNLLFGLAVMGNIHTGLSRTLKEELLRRGTTVAKTLVTAAENHLLTQNDFALHRLLHDAAAEYEDIRYLFIAGPDGGVRVHTFQEGFPRELSRATTPKESAAPLERRPLRTEDGVVQDLSVPLLQGRLGRLHVGLSESPVRRRIANTIALWGAIAGVVLLAGLLIAYALTADLARRVSRIVTALEKVGAGDLSARVGAAGTDEVGRLAGSFDIMVQDLSDSQAQLVRAGKLAAIGELASSVAHEINNPLNTMSVCVQGLQDRFKSGEVPADGPLAEFPEYLETVRGEIMRCKKITEDLLGFSRRKAARRVPTDLPGAVRDALSLVKHRARPLGARLEQAPSAALSVVADPDQIRQVLLNLLLNAVDHLPSSGGRISVAVGRRGDEARVSVEDNGAGIPPENLKRVFEPFFTTKGSGSGTGLGLAICQRIAEEHGGRIEVDSEPGRGARFCLVLPGASDAEASS